MLEFNLNLLFFDIHVYMCWHRGDTDLSKSIFGFSFESVCSTKKCSPAKPAHKIANRSKSIPHYFGMFGHGTLVNLPYLQQILHIFIFSWIIRWRIRSWRRSSLLPAMWWKSISCWTTTIRAAGWPTSHLTPSWRRCKRYVSFVDCLNKTAMRCTHN